MDWVYVCSPYGGLEENYLKTKEYMLDVFASGAIPFAPHVLFHGVLDDNDIKDRMQGIEAGFEFIKHCAEVWVYGNEITEGMAREIKGARELCIPVIYKNG